METVTAAILEMNREILIAKRERGATLECKWEFPGGKVELGETPEQCLAREIMEEVDGDVQVQNFFCSAVYQYPHGEIELLAYNIKYRSGLFHPNVHAEIKWVNPLKLMEYDFAEADIPIAQRLCEKATLNKE